MTLNHLTSPAWTPAQVEELIGLMISDGFGVAEAGNIMGLAASTARSRYHRAKARFVRAPARSLAPTHERTRA